MAAPDAPDGDISADEIFFLPSQIHNSNLLPLVPQFTGYGGVRTRPRGIGLSFATITETKRGPCDTLPTLKAAAVSGRLQCAAAAV